MADVVYHYTDAAGLLGILKTRELWCTHIAFLNDKQEWRHGVEMSLEALRQLAAEKKDEGDYGAFAEALLNFIARNGEDPSVHTPRYCFVASFTDAEDDLGMWRGYSSKGAARYAIGFSPEKLKAIAGKRGMQFEAVTYDAKDADPLARMKTVFRTKIDEKADSFYAGGDRRGRPASHAHSPDLKAIAGDMRVDSGLAHKNHSFKAE